MPVSEWYPDREHWIFTDFYRYSMVEYYVYLSKAVKEVVTPPYWKCMPHSLPTYPMRFYSARYPIFYAENLHRLGIFDYAQISALDWQHKEDVEYIQSLGVKVIGEVDVSPTLYKLDYCFRQSQKFGMDGAFVGVMELLFSGTTSPTLTPTGVLCNQLISEFNSGYKPFTFIEDFASVSDWSVNIGSGAVSGSIASDSANVQEGASGKLNYGVSAATGYDYVDYVKQIAATNLTDKKLIFYVQQPTSTAALLQIRLESANGGYLEYNYTQADGLWRRCKLSIPSDFSDYGTNPNLSQITAIRFRISGDISTTAETNSIYVDALGYTD
jgi:hypothetical protein